MATTARGERQPPQTIDDPPIGIDEASELMSRFGFVAFRTPPDMALPDSCLMAIIHDLPTRQHFDPEAASFWSIHGGHGRLTLVDRETPVPIHRRFSWGRIRLVDRFGARNSFVGFGGTLDAGLVGQDARMLVFRSSAPIFRLPGHSQLEDRLAEHVVAFFGRVLPHLWAHDGAESSLDAAGPDAMFAAFLIDAVARLEGSTAIRSASSEALAGLHHWVAALERHRPAALQAGRALCRRLALDLT